MPRIQQALHTGLLGAIVVLGASAPLPGTAAADPGGTRTYRVTIENLTPSNGGGASQVLSPALALAHAGGFHLFEVGQRANQAVEDVAEDAIAATGFSLFGANPDVEAVVAGPSAPIPPGQSGSFEITTRRNATMLSLVTMLVNTNDAFTGLDAVQLTGGRQEYLTHAYDAGTEVNDQLKASIPGPCCGDTGRNGMTEHGVIAHHPGIHPGIGELSPAQWGWPGGPVARITVERVR
jgi:hypothetical protein